jgi:hypothetical protein
VLSSKATDVVALVDQGRRPIGADKTLPRASSEEREAATRLGAIYLELARLGATPLSPWAIAPKNVRGDVHGPFYAVLGMIYGTDTERERTFGRRGYQSRLALYKRDYDAVVPKLLDATFSFTTLALNSEVIALSTLWKRLVSDQALADWLHTACDEILRQKASKEFGSDIQRDMRELEASRSGSTPPAEPRATAARKGYDVSYLLPAEVKKLIRARLAQRARYAGEDVLNILFEHPDGMTIVQAHARSAGEGRVASTIRVLRAIDAIEKFAVSAIDKRAALRYPFFVLGGVVQRNLRDVPGWPEFAVGLGQVMTRDPVASAITFAAMAVGCLALVFAGPAAPALLTAVLAFGDLGFAGLGLGLTFMREREQDLGSQGSAFRGPANQFATPAVYLDTALAGAATLLSAIAFFGALKQLRAVGNAGGKPRRSQVASERMPAPNGQRLTAPENKAIQDRAKDGARGLNDHLTENTLAKRQDRGERYVTAATSKEDQARAIARDRETQRTADGERGLAGRDRGQVKQPTDKPEATPAQQRMTNRALDPIEPPPPKEVVSRRKLRADERENLQKQIADLLEEYRSESAAKDRIRVRKDALAAKRNLARRRGDAGETARLEAELEKLTDEYNGFDLKRFGDEHLRLRDLLNRTTTEYFDALTSAAIKQEAYAAVASGNLDAVFKPADGVRWVEHVFPKSKIFGMPGFLEKLIWEQQMFLFNLPKNLKNSPAKFNLARGVIPYRSLDAVLANTYIGGQKELKELITLEAQVEVDIARLIGDPRNAELWRSFGYNGPFK